jgi:hypothetical protein
VSANACPCAVGAVHEIQTAACFMWVGVTAHAQKTSSCQSESHSVTLSQTSTTKSSLNDAAKSHSDAYCICWLCSFLRGCCFCVRRRLCDVPLCSAARHCTWVTWCHFTSPPGCSRRSRCRWSYSSPTTRNFSSRYDSARLPPRHVWNIVTCFAVITRMTGIARALGPNVVGTPAAGRRHVDRFHLTIALRKRRTRWFEDGSDAPA